jgi:hypothetical protein
MDLPRLDLHRPRVDLALETLRSQHHGPFSQRICPSLL